MAKILVVDDEEAYCRHLSIMLTRTAHEVQTATSADKATQCSHGFQPDLLIVDYLLGADCTGLELAGRLHKRHPALRTIVITGLASEDLASDATVPVFRFLEKPFSTQDVLSAVHDCLDTPPSS